MRKYILTSMIITTIVGGVAIWYGHTITAIGFFAVAVGCLLWLGRE